MADPTVHLTAGVPDSGTGNITTLGQTLTDGANATLGLTTAAAVVTDATGTVQQYLRGLVKLAAAALGAGTAAAASRTTLASDDPAVASLAKFSTGYYVAVAASQTAAILQSATGAVGDFLAGVLVIPATTAPGVVTILDNATGLIAYPGGGTTALLTLTPFFIPVDGFSRSGAWKITTGANVSVLAIGKFS